MLCMTSAYIIIVTFAYLQGTFGSSIDDSNLPGRTALDNVPLIDGHNDLVNNLYEKLNNSLRDFHFERNLTTDAIFGSSDCYCHTDLPRLRRGKIGAQFWAAYVACSERNIAVTRTLDQIDVIKRLINKYSNDLEYVTTAEGILEAFGKKKIASLIGVEGGHSINNRLSILRMFYELGVRYMTLTHSCDLDWATSATADLSPNTTTKGLSDFGKTVVLEMNRLGMLVDLSHVSYKVMNDAIDISRAPVIFSHSSAKAVYNVVRNVPDDVLKKVVSRFKKDHINHIVDITGVDYVGLGSDFDGVYSLPVGLEDVSKYPDLFDLLKELNPARWTIKNLEKLAGMNFIRVFREAEKVKKRLVNEEPAEDILYNSNETSD